MKAKFRFNSQLCFDAVLTVIMIVFFVASLTFNEKNQLFPLIFSGIGIVLAAFNFLGDLRQAKAAEGEPVPFDATPFLLICVLAAYLFGIFLLGNAIATSIFTFLFVVFWGRQKAKVGIICALISFAVIYLAFGLLMEMPLYKGLLGIL